MQLFFFLYIIYHCDSYWMLHSGLYICMYIVSIYIIHFYVESVLLGLIKTFVLIYLEYASQG